MVTIVAERLLLGHFDYFAAFVLATFGTCAVRELGFVAIRTLGDAGSRQRVMGTA